MNYKHQIKAIFLATSAILGTLWLTSCGGFNFDWNGDNGPLVDVVLFQKKLSGEFHLASIANGHIYAVGKDAVHYSSDYGETWNEIEIKAKSPGGSPRDINVAKIEKVVPSKNGAVFMSKNVIIAMNGKIGYGGWEIGESEDGLANDWLCPASAKFTDITINSDGLIALRDCKGKHGGIKIASLKDTPKKFETNPLADLFDFSLSSVGNCGEKKICLAVNGSAQMLISIEENKANPLQGVQSIATKAGFGDPEKTGNKTGEWEANNDKVNAIGHAGEFYLVGLEDSFLRADAGQTGGLMVFKPGKKAKHYFSGQSVKNLIKSSDGGVYAVTGDGFRYIGDDGQRDKGKDVARDTIENRKDWIMPGFTENRYRPLASYDIGISLLTYDQSQNGNHVIIIGKESVLVGKKDKVSQTKIR